MKISTFALLSTTLRIIAPSSAAPVTSEDLVFDKSVSGWSHASGQHENLIGRQTADGDCTNGPNTRACWYDGFSVATNMDESWPDTGRTVTYDLEITNTTELAPDGTRRIVLAVNGQYPGPTLYANWGDTMIVNVKNSLQHNGTGIHWHGLRMLDQNQYDGVGGVTECPLAPGHTKQYQIRCTQHGTSWYHSHYSVQYGDGVLGAIIINGPATANYDEDLGSMTFTDWYYDTAFALNVRALHTIGAPPLPDNGLVNGSMVSRDGSTGAYQVTHVSQGKKYRLRLINTAIDNYFHISIDSHNFTVITSDFVPIKPFTTSSIGIAVGQRYDIVINANQAIGNYWLRANIATSCAKNANANDIKAILRYSGAPEILPVSKNATNPLTTCNDQPGIIPYTTTSVPADEFDEALNYMSWDFNVTTLPTGGSLVQWLVNSSTILVDWERPSIENVLLSNFTFGKAENVFDVAQKADAWTFWIVQTVLGDPVNLAHPVHLHGHDFYVLGSGQGIFTNASKSTLNFNTPVKRDTTTLPASGWLVLGWPADNPGLWLMHCHIPWHVGAGLSNQFLERKEEIVGRFDANATDYYEVCRDWRSWWNGPERVWGMDDSGL